MGANEHLEELQLPSLELIEAEELRRNFYAFVKAAWPILEGGKPFFDNWHVRVICEHLQAISEQRLVPRDEVPTLIVNVPPGSTKSTIVSVCWPCWEWLSDPTIRYLTGGREADLATRDAVASRRLILSDWYQKQWGYVYGLTGDQNAKTRYENDQRGYRLTISVNAGITGEGGSRFILDDPHDMKKIFSDVQRKSDLDWWDAAAPGRLRDADPSKNARVLIMQRGHQVDMTGHWLTKYKNAVHIVIPMEYDGVRRKTVLGFYDPRTRKGELLDERRFSKKTVAQLKIDLGEYGTAGQLQQSPTPVGGGIIKRAWVRLWPSRMKFPEFKFILQSYDTAFTSKTANDPTAHITLGVFEHDKCMNVMLCDSWDERMIWPTLRAKVKASSRLRYGGDPKHPEDPGKRVDLIVIEEKANGLTLIQDLQQQRLPVAGYNPGDTDKVLRLHAVSPLIQAGLLWAPESKKVGSEGKPRSWAIPWLDQITSFPGSEHDDYVDVTSQALKILRDQGWLDATLRDEDDDLEDREREEDAENAKYTAVRNPYMI
jgi:predicted phage terminase large subunit-like protein